MQTSKRLTLNHIALYKNDLGFFERSAKILSSSEFPPKFCLPIMPDNKSLIIDTLSVSGPGLVTTNFDSEKHQIYVDSIKPDDAFKFQPSKNLTVFLESCIGTELEIVLKVQKNKKSFKENNGFNTNVY
jgi:hypothetical protein